MLSFAESDPSTWCIAAPSPYSLRLAEKMPVATSDVPQEEAAIFEDDNKKSVDSHKKVSSPKQKKVGGQKKKTDDADLAADLNEKKKHM